MRVQCATISSSVNIAANLECDRTNLQTCVSFRQHRRGSLCRCLVLFIHKILMTNWKRSDSESVSVKRCLHQRDLSSSKTFSTIIQKSASKFKIFCVARLVHCSVNIQTATQSLQQNSKNSFYLPSLGCNHEAPTSASSHRTWECQADMKYDISTRISQLIDNLL